MVQADTIQCLTTKVSKLHNLAEDRGLSKLVCVQEIKALARPEFEANPEKFYPTKVFEGIGFTRSRCKCGNYYWRHSETRATCGDSK